MNPFFKNKFIAHKFFPSRHQENYYWFTLTLLNQFKLTSITLLMSIF
jgi:hypothetical protein